MPGDWRVIITPDMDVVRRHFSNMMDEVPRALKAAVDALATSARRHFEGSTATWMQKPTFHITGADSQDTIRRIVGTNDQLYFWISEGTKDRAIMPRNYPYLRFQTGYTPKTRPGSLQSYQGGPFGPFIRVPFVAHHSIAAREFDRSVAEAVGKDGGKAGQLAAIRILQRLP